MKCYFHPVKDAVAICKNCQRGLCMACSVDVENGMACRNRCEEEVLAVNKLVSRGKTAYEKTSSAYFSSAVILGLMGLLMAAGGILTMAATESKFFLVLLPLSIIFLIGAGLYVRNAIKIGK